MAAIRATLSPFHGRTDELARARARLAAGARLIAIVGPGGAGKTRLAQRIAEADGRAALHWIELGAAADADELARAVGVGLDLALAGADDPSRAIAAALRAEDRPLVVLDGCDGALAALAAPIAEWLDAVPALQIVATSRERFRIAAEEVLELGPLPLGEAVAMFVERARRVRHDPALHEDVPAVEALVRRLDALPLAIELAAARMSVMGPDALLRRLAADLDALGAGGRDRGPRHHSMRASIAWSWELLDDAERAALRRLAVFRGGFAVEAAEAVIGEPGALDRIQALRDKSLLREVDAPDVRPRLALYGVIRQFAAEELARDPAEHAAAIGRHAAHYAAWARDLAMRAPTSSAVALARELRPDLEELLAVVAHGAAGDLAAWEAAADVAVTLERWAAEALPLRPWQARLDALADAPAGAGSPKLPRLRLARTWVRLLGGDDRALADELADTRAIAESHADRSIAARAHWMLGWRAEAAGDPDASRRHLERALGELPRTGRTGWDIETEVLATRDLAVALAALGRTDDAKRHLEHAIFRARTAGHALLAGRLRAALAQLLHDLGDLAGALRTYDEALASFQLAGADAARARAMADQAAVLQEAGDLAAAADLLDAALAAHGRREPDRRLAALLGARALLDHEAGRLTIADRGYREAAALLEGSPDPRAEVLFAAALAALCASTDRPAEARAALARAAARAHHDHERLLVQTLGAIVEPPVAPALAAAVDPARRSARLRFAVRLVEATLGQAGRSLVVAPDGGAFQVPGGAPVGLARRIAARRLLGALADLRGLDPGRALSTRALFAIGWPGDRLSDASAAARVYVTIADLRAIGLRGILQGGAGGYRLDPDVPLIRRTLGEGR